MEGQAECNPTSLLAAFYVLPSPKTGRRVTHFMPRHVNPGRSKLTGSSTIRLVSSRRGQPEIELETHNHAHIRGRFPPAAACPEITAQSYTQPSVKMLTFSC